MSKRILIVESDPEPSRQMREALEIKGFSVDETPNGKKSVDRVRETRPNLVILSVELAAGQSGYIICGKLKKDEELKGIPVVIVGNPDGFVQHSKLKTHADEYVPKPVDDDVLLERVSGLIGWPEAAVGADDSLTLDDVIEDGQAADGLDDIPVDEATIQGDPDLDMLDSAFEGLTSPSGASNEESVEAPPEELEDSPAHVSHPFDGAGVSEDADRAMESLKEEQQPPPARPLARNRSSGAPGSDLEVRALRAQLNSLQKSLSEAQSRQNDAEDRVRDLEAQLESGRAEVEAIASTGGKGDKDFFALREALNKKEKDLLLLTTDLKDKETEMVDLRDHEVKLEQQLSEAAVELARRDAQIKALSNRTDQSAADRKRLQEELNETRNKLQASVSEAEEMRSMIAQLETASQQAERDSDSQVKRVQELEELGSKQEDRITKLYQRIKGDDKVRDKTKKALSIALHLLEEHSGSDEEDEPAAA